MTSNANGDANRIYENVAVAQLGERVTNLNRRQTDLELEMRNGFRAIEQSIQSLTTNLSERNKPQWQAIGVALTFCTVLGGLAYIPIREATSDLKSSVSVLAERMVTREEMDMRAARGAEDRGRMESAIAEIRRDQVPRVEIERILTGIDQRFSDHQRQIEQTNTAYGSTYNARDVILDLRERLDRLERERTSP